MTPAEYGSRCAEMLRTNAHNISASEIERLAFGAGVPVTRMLAAQMDELEYLADQSSEDDLFNAIQHAQGFMR